MHGLEGPIVTMFVDDINMIELKKSGVIEKVKRKLIVSFVMVDIGPMSFYLGLKIE